MKEYKYKINGNMYNVTIGDIDNNIAQVEVNGTPYSVELQEQQAAKKVSVVKPAAAPRTDAGTPVIKKPAAPAAGGASITSPLPGVVISFNVKVGDAVKAGQTVFILEAMKMENDIHAPKDGVVKSISVNQGDSVLEGTVVMTIE